MDPKRVFTVRINQQAHAAAPSALRRAADAERSTRRKDDDDLERVKSIMKAVMERRLK